MNDYIVRGYQGNPYVSDLSNAVLLWEEEVVADTDYDAHLIATQSHNDYAFTDIEEIGPSDAECMEMTLMDYQDFVNEVIHWLTYGDSWYTPPGGEREDRIYLHRDYLLQRSHSI